jgi:hypothetical protein
MPYGEDSDPWECGICMGEVVPMGALGSREHGRCRDCGMDQSRNRVNGGWNQDAPGGDGERCRNCNEFETDPDGLCEGCGRCSRCCSCGTFDTPQTRDNFGDIPREQMSMHLESKYSASYFLEFAERSFAMTRQELAEEFKPIVNRILLLGESDEKDAEDIVESLIAKVRHLKEAGVEPQLLEFAMGDAFSLIKGLFGGLMSGGGEVLKTLVRKLVMKIAGWLGLGDLGQAAVGLFAQSIMVGIGRGGITGLTRMFTDCRYAGQVVTTALVQVLSNPSANIISWGMGASIVAKLVSANGAFEHINALVSNTICDQLGLVGDKLTAKAKEKLGGGEGGGGFMDRLKTGMQNLAGGNAPGLPAPAQ